MLGDFGKKKKKKYCRPIIYIKKRVAVQYKKKKKKERHFELSLGYFVIGVNCLLDFSLNVCGFVASINVCVFGRVSIVVKFHLAS